VALQLTRPGGAAYIKLSFSAEPKVLRTIKGGHVPVDKKENPAGAGREQIFVRDEDFMDISAANEVVSELLGKAGVVWQEGEQQYFVLAEEDVDKVLAKLAAQAPAGFIQTNEWVRADSPAAPGPDDLLEALAARLRAGSGADEPAAADQVQCAYGDEINVLADAGEVQAFIANLAAADAGNYSKTQLWNKQSGGPADGQQIALLREIAARLRAVEEILLRLESKVAAR